MLEGSGDVDAYAAGFSPIYSEIVSVSAAAAVAKNVPYIWSLNQYKSSTAADPEKKEEWDELEKSVLAKVADEIEIGISGGFVEMIVYKEF